MWWSTVIIGAISVCDRLSRVNAAAETRRDRHSRRLALPKVAATEIFLEPDVEHDEHVAGAHFLDLQLGDAGLPVAPRNRNRRPRIAAHDGLERQFDGQVEMRREERAKSVQR